ncbi:SGNH hydrolase-type esterase domain-containing protein [Tricladium varicosporioides]|nr:SGNH hydrolase-type esterase domain-containing protein [Hymenoscyphus varicosporioides]
MFSSNVFAQLAVGAGLLIGSSANGAPLRILPLGDSITAGFNEASGNSYRRDLECLLSSSGNPVQYIGSQHSGNWPDNAHDGFSGYRIEQIASAAAPEINRTSVDRANLVLIHAGTNDCVQNFNVSTAPQRLGELVDSVYGKNPTAVILVMQPILNANSDINNRINTFNAALPAIINTRINNGVKVRLASQPAVTAAQLVDGTHPGEAGYWVMAQKWYEVIQQVSKELQFVAAEGSFVDGGKESLPSSGLGECSASSE